jgi:hypothetical protein
MNWLRCITMMVVVLTMCGVVRAQHAHDEPNVEEAKTLAESLSRIESQRAAIQSGLTSAKLDDVDTAAFTLSMLAKSVGRVALADSAVAKEKVKAINLLGRQIGAEAEGLHDAAGSGKLQEAQMRYATLKPLLAKLMEAGEAGPAKPEKYVCEMHCEGTKQYDKPGTCPVCGMELTKVSETPYYTNVAAPGSVEAGKPVTLEINLLQPSGDPVGKLDTVHEYTLHFMIMSEDLSFYSHQHPTRRADGVFELKNVVFPFGGKFVVYSDFTPTGAANQVCKTEFKVADGSVPRHEPVKLVSDFDGVGKDGDYEFRVRCNGQDFVAGTDMFLRYGIDLKFKPVTDLEPLMGAMGHLVIVSAGFKHYVHAHPLDFDEKKQGAQGHGDHAGHDHGDSEIMKKGREMLLGNGRPSDVVFHAVFPEPGMYRVFAQFQHKGKVMTYAVSIDVKPNPDGKSAPAGKMDHSAHDHAGPEAAKPGAPAGGK